MSLLRRTAGDRIYRAGTAVGKRPRAVV